MPTATSFVGNCPENERYFDQTRRFASKRSITPRRRRLRATLDMYTFDDDLFATNPNGLGSYFDSEGWQRLNLMKAPREQHYRALTPASLEIAGAMLAGVRERRRWGRQLPHGAWSTYTAGEPVGRFRVRGKDGGEPYFVEPVARTVGALDLRKHLTGRTLSVGTTDRPVVDAYDSLELRRRHRLVTCLRIDVDHDRAWLRGRHEEVLAEMRSQRDVVEATGLPYLVFATGGRGVQIVVPLPCPLEPSVASLLSRGLRRALRLRRVAHGAQVDRDSFDGLMRLAGGVHRVGNTAAFVAVDAGRLHDLPTQARLLASCLTGEAPGSGGALASASEVFDAQMELIPKLREIGLLEFEVASEGDVDAAVRRAPRNVIARMILAAHEAAGAPMGTVSAARPRAAAPNTSSLASCDRAWAERTWSEPIHPGAFWDWVHMGGGRGMLAAVVIFGSERAPERLHEKAEERAAASPRDGRERHFVIDSLWRSFGLKEFRPRTYAPMPSMPERIPEATADLAVRLAARLKTSLPTSKWPVERAEAILAILLCALEASPSGEVLLGLRDIAAMVNAVWGERYTNAVRVRETLRRLCQGSAEQDRDPECVLHAFYRQHGVRSEGEKTLYLPGPELVGTHVHDACRERWEAGCGLGG